MTCDKAICSICYEDLKPIAEDLHSISKCGHVFHELCLQQWFEYCSGSKKRTCPVCKQGCAAKDSFRLYFQSVGDQNESCLSQKVVNAEKDPTVLCREVKRLEVKVSGLTSGLERKEKELEEVANELSLCKVQLNREVTERSEALREKAQIQRLFQSKSQECGTSQSECIRLKERNMALAKELAAMKLVSDVNIQDDEILKLASFGHEENKNHTIDTLIRSLAIRNKSYKELIGKCNILGRDEAHSSRKLEKAREKVEKLKKRVKELETIGEEKDNAVLRALKASSKKCSKINDSSRANDTVDPLRVNNFPSKIQGEHQSINMNKSVMTGDSYNDESCFGQTEQSNCIDETDTYNTKESPIILIDDDTPKVFAGMAEIAKPNSQHQKTKDVSEGYFLSKADAQPDVTAEARTKVPVNVVDAPSHQTDINSGKGCTLDLSGKDVMFNIIKDSPPTPVSEPGNICFSSGLLGPDGTNRFLGKWCKRGQNKGDVAAMGSVGNSGDLISVGADGRGGRVKVLRSRDGKENVVNSKRLKSSVKTQGTLHIEHFFGRVNH